MADDTELQLMPLPLPPKPTAAIGICAIAPANAVVVGASLLCLLCLLCCTAGRKLLVFGRKAAELRCGQDTCAVDCLIEQHAGCMTGAATILPDAKILNALFEGCVRQSLSNPVAVTGGARYVLDSCALGVGES